MRQATNLINKKSSVLCKIISLRSGGGYTYTTLSDYANSESCDRGCNQGQKYRCKSGYTYSNGKCTTVPSKTCEDYTSGQNIYVTPGPSVNPNKQCKALTLPSGKQYGFDDAYPAGDSMRCLKCAVKGSGSGGTCPRVTSGKIANGTELYAYTMTPHANSGTCPVSVGKFTVKCELYTYYCSSSPAGCSDSAPTMIVTLSGVKAYGPRAGGGFENSIFSCTGCGMLSQDIACTWKYKGNYGGDTGFSVANPGWTVESEGFYKRN